jgi:large subunit ribosomal protein L15
MLKLHALKPAKGSKQSSKRLGRGHGSGRGKTSGRGTKGQKARSGVSRAALKLKGMKLVFQRIPKQRGFSSLEAKPETVTLRALGKAFDENGLITPGLLAKKGLASSAEAKVKIVGSGDVKRKWTVKGCAVSGGARSAIEKAGGTVPSPKP